MPTSLELQLYARTRESMRLLIMSALDVQKMDRAKEARKYYADEQYLKEYCTVRVAGPRMTGHTSAIAALCYELEHRNKFAAIATTAVAACQARERNGNEHWPVFTPHRKLLSHCGPSDVIFVDNAFSMSVGTEGNVYAYAKYCLEHLGHVVIALVQ